MVGTTVAVILAQGGEFERIQLVAEVLFFQNYEPGLWIHTWSLAVEEHFYLLLPLVFLLAIHARRRKPSLRLLLVIGAILAAGSLALRVATAADIPAYHPFTHTFPTHLRLDSLFFGVMLAYAYNVHRRRFVQLLAPWRAPLILGGLLLLSPAFLLTLETSPIVYTVGYTMLYLGSGMLLAGAVLCDVPRGPVVGRLATLGALSYSIYLWHMPVFRLGVPLLEQLVGAPFAFGVRVLLYLGGSLAVGVTMARLVELPALAARDRRVPSRARLAAGTRMPRTLETPVGSAAIV
jgi:peptidoglycan/LPS O-acetylase OafA/YrhL